jgi:acetyl esterase/lipase
MRPTSDPSPKRRPSRRDALGLIAAGPLLGGAADAGPAEIAYGPSASQRLDVYPRPGPAAAPLLLYVHGGAWSVGDKRDVHALPAFARRHGFLLASAGYRLGAGAGKAAEDVGAAAAWLLANGAAFGGDPRRLFLVGWSAGGQLAALVGIDPRYLARSGRAPADLAGVIGVDGAGYDAATELPSLARRLPPAEFAGWTRAFQGDAATLSPIRLVRPGRRYPPALLFYTDRVGARRQCERLAGALRLAGAAAAVVAAPGKSHEQIDADLGRIGDPAGERAARFIATGDPLASP